MKDKYLVQDTKPVTFSGIILTNVRNPVQIALLSICGFKTKYPHVVN